MLRRLWMGLAALLLFLGLLAGSVLAVGLNAPLMARQFERYGQAAGIAQDAQREAIASEIVEYLAHRRSDLPTFQAHEQAHMADVRGIFDSLWALAIAGLASGILLWRFRRRGSLKTCWKVFLGLGVILVGLVAWAMIDFDSLFILFHQVAFTNDLWLLDPRTDLMIQLMPTPFFIDYAARIAGLFAGLAAGTGCLAAGLNRRYER